MYVRSCGPQEYNHGMPQLMQIHTVNNVKMNSVILVVSYTNLCPHCDEVLTNYNKAIVSKQEPYFQAMQIDRLLGLSF